MTHESKYNFEIVREIQYGAGNRPANGRGDRLVFERCQITGAGRVRKLDGENRIAWEEQFFPTGATIEESNDPAPDATEPAGNDDDPG